MTVEQIALFNIVGFFLMFVRVEHRLTKIETMCKAKTCQEEK